MLSVLDPATCQASPTLYSRLSRIGLAVITCLVLVVGLRIGVAAAAVTPLAGASSFVPPASPAAEWMDFYPLGWVNSLPLSSGVTVGDASGLAADSAAFRISTDGGASWTGWATAGLSVTTPSATLATLVVSNLNFPDSPAQNRIQFQIENLVRQTLISPAYPIAVDTTAPASPFNLQSEPADWTNTNLFTETWSNPPDPSGIVAAYYQLDREPTSPTDGTFVATTDMITGLVMPTEGIHSISIWLVDGAGNLDHRNYRVDLGSFRYDATPPLVGVALDGPMGRNGWFTGTVTATFTPFDALSGLESWGWTLDQGISSNAPTTIITDDLAHTLLVTATDQAGNVAPGILYHIPLDSTPPLLDYTISLSPTATYWYTAPLTVTFELSDAVSGPDLVRWQLDDNIPASGLAVEILQEGQHILHAVGLDVAGNSSPPLALSLPLDSMAPSTTLAISPPVAPSGYFTAPLLITFAATDDPPGTPPGTGSGVVHTLARVDDSPWQPAQDIELSTDGYYRVSAFSQDLAGNVEISQTRIISLDMIAPGAPPSATVSPTTWTPTNTFTLDWQNPDDTSGVVGAYVYLGEGPPDPTASAFYTATNQVTDLMVPEEGEYPVWLWLQDAAGNASIGNAILIGSMRYDATPPKLEVAVAGPSGNAGWYVGPIQATLAISDAGSGPDLLHYRLDGQPWQQTGSLSVTLGINMPGKHVLDYYGQDLAGQLSEPGRETLRVDPDPPDPPYAMAVEPSGWSNSPQFTLIWRNPIDASGVATAHVDFVSPVDPQDGQSFPAAYQAAPLDAPGEGRHAIYLWLEDVAGNVSVDRAGVLENGIQYDATPPVTVLSYDPQPSAAGWFNRDVEVTLVAEDALSGPGTTTYQLDGGEPVTGTLAFISGDGQHSLLVSSTDQAGNTEPPTSHPIRIDTQAPTGQLYALSRYSADPDIPVRWRGDDVVVAQEKLLPDSSGIAGYDVQVKEGSNGSWQDWLTGTTQTQAVFEGQRGQVYRFRARSIDGAGNVSPWSTAGESNVVWVDPVENGSFHNYTWQGWDIPVATLDYAMIADSDLYPGLTVPAARLGSEVWEACNWRGNFPPMVLCGDSHTTIGQTVTVSSLSDNPEPTLQVWYRVRTYDQVTTTASIWASLCPTLPGPPWLVDSFDITGQVVGSSERELLWQDGNPLPQIGPGPNPPIPLRDLGWRLATIDMTPYAGQDVDLRLGNHVRLDARFNTWTDVHGIRIVGPQRRIFLPTVPQEADPGPGDPPIFCTPDPPPQSQPPGAYTPMTELLTPNPEEGNR